jgi:Pyruvate/2-oxoacid:ferredoxin oxidoreductase delta subunit
MKTLHARTLLMASLLIGACLSALAADYRGVEVGQRTDFLPPEFDEVARGTYEARFGKEVMQVFSAGALVQGFKVIPLAPMTLAEALAAHSPDADEYALRMLVNFNGVFLALADSPNHIAYFAQSVRADSIVRAIGYYDDQTALTTFAAPLNSDDAAELIAAARSSSRDAKDERPEITSPLSQASYLVDEAVEASRAQAENAVRELRAYSRLCTGTPSCDALRRQRGAQVQTATARFLVNLMRAENAYQANANLVGERPSALIELQELSDDLVKKVRQTDYVGFAYPIYAADIPRNMRDFIKGLILSLQGEKLRTQAFFICTFGYVNGFGPFNAAGLLRGSMKMKAHLNLRFFNNVSNPALKAKMPDERKLKRTLENARKKLIRLAGELASGRRVITGIGPYLIPGIIIRNTVGKARDNHYKGLSVDMSRCSHCMRCVRECPTGSIRYEDGVFSVLPTCVACMRCYNFCPRAAVLSSGVYADPEVYQRYRGPVS